MTMKLLYRQNFRPNFLYSTLLYTHGWGFKTDMQPVSSPDFEQAGLPFDWSLLIDLPITGQPVD